MAKSSDSLCFTRNLCRGNLHCFFIWGCLLIFFTMVLVSLEPKCSLNHDIKTIAGHVQDSQCRDYYYKHLNLSARGPKDCMKIISGDRDEVRKALIDNLIVKNKKALVTDEEYLTLTKDCTAFKKSRKYVTFSLSKEEERFPIAYSMVIHDSIEMFERLLRAIYVPQNIYCVHVDKKSPEIFLDAVRTIASCFHNVFVASELETVVYASWSRVQADFNCMQDLLKREVQWKYLINTCGSDFPLKTNAEIVRALKLLNGKNSIESEKPPEYKKRRWEYHYAIKDSVLFTSIKKDPPPFKTSIYSGNAYIVITREFVISLFENTPVKQLIKWAKDTYSPDEFIWATLNRVPELPGHKPKHYKYDLSDINAIARLVKWQHHEGDVSMGAPYSKCTGVHRREICVYGSGDLSWMLQQHHLFANKFDPKVDDNVIQCLEEYLRFKSFYPTENVDVNVLHPTVCTQQHSTLDSLNRPIKKEEILEVISKLKKNKAPSPDGFNNTFYSTFGYELADYLTEVFNEFIEEGKIPVEMLQAAISPILKQDKDSTDTASYRPISLINNDLKMYSSVLANRIQKVISSLIHKDQIGFIQGRQSSNNIRRLLSLTEEANRTGQPQLTLSLDAEKAFDRVGWGFMSRVLGIIKNCQLLLGHEIRSIPKEEWMFLNNAHNL
ncbi:beta-1,3-galactosyl-O-glycosyl-glycoprotein beta-1,6-N-acetylglucosaminyltransferase 3-like [Pelodytes ibericus]